MVKLIIEKIKNFSTWCLCISYRLYYETLFSVKQKHTFKRSSGGQVSKYNGIPNSRLFK